MIEQGWGGLRFKDDLDGVFLDDDHNKPTPPWSEIRELQFAAKLLEDKERDFNKAWLNVLIATGSSLGGARPKANVLDRDENLWIAKFPSKNDMVDKGAWEYLAYKLAVMSGINMATCKLEKIHGPYHTFFTKRFDREGYVRVHFSSAMTMTGYNENILRDKTASYLDIVEFISANGSNVDSDLKQLWRRIVFNIAISNTDDHLRNHGFVLTPRGWELSPAYDLNPSVDKNHLSLNIDDADGALDLRLAKQDGEYFRLTETEMESIISEVLFTVSHWKNIADEIGIPRVEIEMVRPAFWQQ